MPRCKNGWETLIYLLYYNSRGGQSAARAKDFLRPLYQILDAQLFMMHLCKKNTQNLHQLCDLYVRKIRKKIFLRPQNNILMKFGPSEKKSGHPCSIAKQLKTKEPFCAMWIEDRFILLSEFFICLGCFNMNHTQYTFVRDICCLSRVSTLSVEKAKHSCEKMFFEHFLV